MNLTWKRCWTGNSNSTMSSPLLIHTICQVSYITRRTFPVKWHPILGQRLSLSSLSHVRDIIQLSKHLIEHPVSLSRAVVYPHFAAGDARWHLLDSVRHCFWREGFENFQYMLGWLSYTSAVWMALAKAIAWSSCASFVPMLSLFNANVHSVRSETNAAGISAHDHRRWENYPRFHKRKKLWERWKSIGPTSALWIADEHKMNIRIGWESITSARDRSTRWRREIGFQRPSLGSSVGFARQKWTLGSWSGGRIGAVENWIASENVFLTSVMYAAA